MYMAGKAVGMIVGAIVAFVICFVAFRKLNKNGKSKTEYDERQKAIRDEGFKYGFWTLSAYLLVLIFLDSLEIELPMTQGIIYILGYFVAISVVIVHSIWNEAYFGINNIQKRWYYFMAIVGVANFAIAILGAVNGEMIVDGKVSSPCVNLLCGLLFVVVLVTTVAKNLHDKKMESEIEE